MIPDEQTNTVYVSDKRSDHWDPVCEGLKSILGKRLCTIPNTKDIWCRDYMPVQIGPDRFVQFRYDPDYLQDDPEFRTDDAAKLIGLINCERSGLIIDGGNIVRWSDAAILTDKIYKENPSYSRPELRKALQETLEVNRLVVIPKEPDDEVGHSDGMVRFVNADTLLVNDYANVDSAFGKRLSGVLKQHGFKLIPFQYCPTDEIVDGIASAVGVYINFAQINDMIICPAFGEREDAEALRVLETVFPGVRIVPLECREMARHGGVLNCVTWNIYSNGR